MSEEQKPLTEREMELIMQLPNEDCHDVYYAEGEPQEEFHYPLYHDEVLKVDINYDEPVAKLKLARLVNNKGATRVGEVFYTGRFWCQRVTY